MVTSDFTLEVEIQPFRACPMHLAIIIGKVRSLWTWLWGRYHIPQNIFLVFVIFGFNSSPEIVTPLTLNSLQSNQLLLHKYGTQANMPTSHNCMHLLHCRQCYYGVPFSKSVGVDRCFHKKVGGWFQFRCLYMLTKCRCTAFMTYSLALWAQLASEWCECMVHTAKQAQ